MKIQEIYKNEFIAKAVELFPNYRLFNYPVEYWQSYDWEEWAKISTALMLLNRK